MGNFIRSRARLKRKKRVRKKVKGTQEKPRLSIFRSSKHIYAQIIDDTHSKTLAVSSSLSKSIQTEIQGKGGNLAGASIIGENIAKQALEKEIKQVVFDRNGFLYHGRIKALAEAAREHGLIF